MNAPVWVCWVITSRSLPEVPGRGWLVRFLLPDVVGSPGVCVPARRRSRV